MMHVIDEIAAERRRQIEVEGWSVEHDDQHGDGEMALAAACYAANQRNLGYPDQLDGDPFLNTIWPWSDGWWKPKDRRRDLIRAAALLVAEIERLDRTDAAR